MKKLLYGFTLLNCLLLVLYLLFLIRIPLGFPFYYLVAIFWYILFYYFACFIHYYVYSFTLVLLVINVISDIRKGKLHKNYIEIRKYVFLFLLNFVIFSLWHFIRM